MMLKGHSSVAIAATTYGRAQVGKNYNWAFRKYNEGAHYCSELVWQAYKALGTDLDSNGGFVVSPDDIARSPYLTVVYHNTAN